MSTINVNGVDYVPAADAPPPPPIRIVVLDRGWVVVGRVTQNGDDIVITDASVIRKWGTTAGLGQLRDGPTGDTALDRAGVVRARGMVLSIDCNEASWSARL